MADKQKYYSGNEVLKTDFQYAFIVGQRANGKSYFWKKYCVEQAFKNGIKFVYLRRWKSDIKENAVSSYFDDCPVKEITKGLYDGIIAFRGYLYFYYLDGDDKLQKAVEIGRYCALNEDSRYKSQVFENVRNIVYEEVIPVDNMYIENECVRLQGFASTVFRREKGKVILIANTLSRVCPYVKEWCLDNFLRQKKNTIDIYNFHVNDAIIRIAVEYCDSIQYKNTMFFGNASKQILSGEWEVTDVAKLPKPLEEYEELYKIQIEYQNFKFMLLLLCDPFSGGKVCYVYPYTKDKDYWRILTDRFSDDPFISARLDTTKIPERDIAQCFSLNKVCYCDNLTGSDFRSVNEHFKIAPLF